MNFGWLSYSGILLKSETVSCEPDLSFRQQGSPGVWEGLSFVHHAPLWGAVLTEERGEAAFCGREEGSPLPGGDLVPVIASNWTVCPVAGTASISLIKPHAGPPPLPAAEARAEYIFLQSVCFHCCPLKIMSSFYSLARNVTLDRFEIIYLLSSPFRPWFHSFVSRGTQPGRAESARPSRRRLLTETRRAYLTFTLSAGQGEGRQVSGDPIL